MPPLPISAEHRVIRITFPGTDPQNLLNLALITALLDSLQTADADPRCGAILLDATGPFFCAGLDYPESRSWTVDQWLLAERLLTCAQWLRKPLIAAIQGPALGAGVTVVANAHFAVASQGTSYALTDIRIGAWPSLGYEKLREALGSRRLLALALTGRVFSAPEALQFGLVHEVTPPFELDDRATALAEHLSLVSPPALEFGLRQHALAETAVGHLGELILGEDVAEGLTANQEKRRPVWPSLRHIT